MSLTADFMNHEPIGWRIEKSFEICFQFKITLQAPWLTAEQLLFYLLGYFNFNNFKHMFELFLNQLREGNISVAPPMEEK